MIKLNLLPYKEERRKAAMVRQLVIVVASITIFIFIIGITHIYMTMTVNRLERDVEAAGKKLEELTKITGDLEKFKQDKTLVEKKIAIIDRLEKGRTGPVHLLDEFATRIPKREVWLSAIEEVGPTLEIEGMAKDNPTIALFMKTLEESPYIQSVDLISSKQEVVSDVKLMRFRLSCTTKMV
jgi:type IV pilus assembly protein PilN